MHGRLLMGVLALLLAVKPGAATCDEVLATLGSPWDTRLSAYGGQVVWSERIAPGRHVLMRWQQGRVDRLPVSERAVPFDVDLGADARGRPVAVYSRCPGETEAWGPVGGCDVYRLLLAGGSERKLGRVSTAQASEYAPTIWRGGVAYVSSKTPRSQPRLRLLRRAASRPVPLRGGRVLAGGARVGAMDLTSNALVFTWSSGDSSQLWRVPLTGRRGRVLAKGFVEEGFADQPVSPNAAPAETVWVRALSTPCIQTMVVSDHRGRRRATAPTSRDIRALARDGTTLYAITSSPAPCSVPPDVALVRLAPLVFIPPE
jgi:hypothetical protein